MNKMKWMPILAAAVLLIGVGATVYVSSIQVDSDLVLIYGEKFSTESLFEMAGEKTLNSYSGAPLDQVMAAVGVENLPERQYTLIGADGYQKTVTWADMENGILTSDRVSYFPDLPRAFHVRDIIEIKVE